MPTRNCILIVDDDDTNAMLLEHAFDKAGYRLLCAHNRRQTLELLAENRCDALVLNGSMERTDGLKLLNELKAMPEYTHIPVILESSSGNAGERAAARNGGACNFYVRPYDIELLVTEISGLLKDRLKKSGNAASGGSR